MSSFFRKNKEEIDRDPALSYLGVALAASHLWTFFLWNSNGFFWSSLGPRNSVPICFPFFPNCDLYRTLDEGVFQVLLWGYLALTLFCIYSFLENKFKKCSYGLFFALFLFKNIFYLSNFNFMGNYHYMLNITYLAFLFFPHKKAIIKYLVVAFYIAAGLLKINPEWLTGAAMISTPMIAGPLLSVSLVYVIFLELFFVFGVLSANRWIRWFCLLQLVAFHLFSWHIVGFFYPMVMFSILSVFFIDEYFYYTKKAETPNLLQDLFYFKRGISTYIILGLFTLMQFFPYLIAKDPALSGTPRLSSLNMFDAYTECHPLLIAHKKGQVVHLQKNSGRMGVRIQCDPIVLLNQIHQLCRQNENTPEFDRLSFSLVSKRTTENDFHPVLFLDDACNTPNLMWAEFARWGVFP